MGARTFLLIVITGVLAALSVGHVLWVTAQETGPANVSIGSAVFFPNTLTRTGTSSLMVSVSTTPAVPSIGANGSSPIRAAVELSEISNINGISYSITPPQVTEIDLVGTGRSSNATFAFTINPRNKTTGNVSYQAKLIRLENAPADVTISTPTTSDATLTIAAPTPSPSREGH